MSEVVMPRLSDTMEEGELSKWLKNVGDAVAKGDILAEIETDKATMDLEAFEAGVLEQQLVAAGTVVPIGTPVAIIGAGTGAKSSPVEPVETRAAAEDSPPVEEKPLVEEPPEAASRNQVDESDRRQEQPSAPASQLPSPVEPSPSPVEPSPSPVAPPSSPVEPVETPAAAQVSPPVEPVETPANSPGELRTSPLARKIAREHGIDLAKLTGSGPQGRIVRADVEAAIAAGPATPPATQQTAPQTAAVPPAAGLPSGDEEVPVNRIRLVAAKRLTESQAVPHFFLTSVVDVEKLLEFRTEVNASLESQGIKASINDVLVRAVAVALRQHPEANSSWGGDKLLRHAHVNIGIAVATEAGLLVPVIRDADRKGLGEIAQETVALAAKARDGKLSIDEMTGGTFSISNLGMFGIDQFTAVINPPEAAILAVGAASPVPVLRDGVLVDVPKLKITLTVDHRVMDGAVAAGFLRDLVGILEQPLRIVI